MTGAAPTLELESLLVRIITDASDLGDLGRVVKDTVGQMTRTLNQLVGPAAEASKHLDTLTNSTRAGVGPAMSAASLEVGKLNTALTRLNDTSKAALTINRALKDLAMNDVVRANAAVAGSGAANVLPFLNAAPLPGRAETRPAARALEIAAEVERRRQAAVDRFLGPSFAALARQMGLNQGVMLTPPHLEPERLARQNQAAVDRFLGPSLAALARRMGQNEGITLLPRHLEAGIRMGQPLPVRGFGGSSNRFFRSLADGELKSLMGGMGGAYPFPDALRGKLSDIPRAIRVPTLSLARELTPVVDRLAYTWSRGFGVMESATNRFHSRLAGASAFWQQALLPLALGVGAAEVAVTSFVAKALHDFARFDDQLTRVAGHMNDLAGRQKPFLSSAVLGLAANSRVGPDELAGGLDVLARHGMNAAMSVRALALAERFAVASGMDMARATKELVGIQFALGEASLEPEKHLKNMVDLSDLLVGASQRVGASVEDFTAAFKGDYAATVRGLGISTREATAFLGLYMAQLKDGRESGDRASRALIQLSDKAATNYFQWQRLGLTLHDAAGHVRPLTEIVKNFTGVLAGVPEQTQYARLKFMGFEDRAIRAILPLIGMGKELQDLEKHLETVGGVTDALAGVMGSTLAGQVQRLWNNISVLSVLVGEALAPALTLVVDTLKDLIQGFTGLHPQARQFIVVGVIVATVAAAIGLALAGLALGGVTLLIALLPGLAAAFGMVAAVLSVGLVPLLAGAGGLVLTFLIGLAAACLVLVATLPLVAGLLGGLFKDFGRVTWADFVAGTKDALTGIIGFFYNFAENLDTLWRFVGDHWEALLTDMLAGSVIFLTNLAHNWSLVMDSITDMLKFFGGWLLNNWRQLGQTQLDLFVTGLKLIGLALEGGLGLVVAAFEVYGKRAAYNFVRGFITSYDELLGKVGGLGGGAGKLIPLPGMGVKFGALFDKAFKPDRSAAEEMAPLTKSIIGDTVARIGDLLRSGPVRNNADWGGLLSGLGAAGAGPLAGMRGLLEGFVPSLKSLPKLNLALPGGGLQDSLMKLASAFSPHAEPSTNPLFAGKGGPGFQFRQVSLSRFMVGGEAAETLDHQQLQQLRIIASATRTLAMLARGGRLAFGAAAGPMPALGR